MANTMCPRSLSESLEQEPDGGRTRGCTRVLSVRGLSVRYGRSVRALEDVSIEVPGDGVLAVLGGNGAGKSTLLRAVSGTLGLHRGAITAGEIAFDGERIDRLDPAAVVRRRGRRRARGPAGLRPDDRRGEPAGRWPRGAVGGRRASSARTGSHELFPVLAERGRAAGRACCPAASSRCSPSAGR